MLLGGGGEGFQGKGTACALCRGTEAKNVRIVLEKLKESQYVCSPECKIQSDTVDPGDTGRGPDYTEIFGMLLMT